MSTLTGRTIADSYTELLKTSSTTGLSSSLATIEDGDATVSALSISTAGIASSGTLSVSSSTSLNTLSVSGASTFTGNASFATLNSSNFSATMVGGTINGASIGSTSPSTGVFTQVNVTGAGALRLEDTAGGQYVGFKSPTTIATSYTLTLPSATGSAGFTLITDGSGNLTWQNPSGVGGGVSLISAGDTSLAIVDSGTGTVVGSVDGVQKFLLDASGMSITGDLTVSGTFAGTATNANTLTTGRNFSITGDVTAPAISFNGSGNVALASTLASGVVNNANVGASAAIAFSKLASLTSGNILVGNASNVPTSVAVSGDATIANTGAVTIANNAITNAKVSTSAAIAFSKLGSLTTGQIVAGNAGVATATTLGGDATIGATGTLTIANDAITTAKILNSNVTSAKVDTTSVAVLGTAQQYTRTHNFYLNTPLTDAASIAWDASQNQVATVTLTATGRTLANPTNLASGAVYILIVKQNGTGNNTLSFGGNYKWPSSATPTVTQTANSASILTFISDGTLMYGVSSLNYT